MAIKGQGAILQVASVASGSALAVSAATKATTCALTTASNTFANGDIVSVASVGGMYEINDRAFVASAVGATACSLKGVDSTNYHTYTAGGTVQKWTMISVGKATDLKGFDGQAAEVDVTHLLSVAKEYSPGLQDFGSASLTVWLDPADAGQTRLRALKESGGIVPFSLAFTDGSIAAFMAFVKQFSFDNVKPDGAVSGSVTLRVTGAPAWFA